MLDLGAVPEPHASRARTRVMLLIGLAMFGVFFYVSLYMQQVLGYSPTQAGASFLPMDGADHPARAAGRAAGRPLRPAAARRRRAARARRSRSLLFSRMGVGRRASGRSCRRCCSAGSGWRWRWRRSTAAAMGSVQRDKAGVGSAVLNSMRQVGGSLGIAIMGAIVAAGVSSVARSAASRTGRLRERLPPRARGRGALIASSAR